MGDTTDIPSISASQPATAPKLATPKPKKKIKDYIFAETNQGANFSYFGAGYLPVNEDWIKFLVLTGYEMRRQGMNESSFNHRVASHAYKVEPQLQLNLFENSNNFLAKSQIYFRSQYDIVDSAAGDQATQHSLNNELVHKFNKEYVVLRSNFIINSVGDPVAREIKWVIAPFVKTPSMNLPVLRHVRFRFAPEYTHNFSANENSLLLHAKLEWDIRSDPWWGWSIQTFWSVDIEGRKDRANFDFSGIYLWTGSVLPKSWLGEGYFVEGGIWMGKGPIVDGVPPFLKATALGFNIKIKFGTECRWWQ